MFDSDHLDLTSRRVPKSGIATDFKLFMLGVLMLLGFIAGTLASALGDIREAIKDLKPAPVSAPAPTK